MGLARGRRDPARVLRRRRPVRGRAAPWRRPRTRRRDVGARAGSGGGDVRRNRADPRADGHDPDVGGLQGVAHAPRRAAGAARCGRGRRRPDRRAGAVRDSRACRPVRASRDSHGRRHLPRSTVAASATGRRDPSAGARGAARTCSHASGARARAAARRAARSSGAGRFTSSSCRPCAAPASDAAAVTARSSRPRRLGASRRAPFCAAGRRFELSASPRSRGRPSRARRPHARFGAGSRGALLGRAGSGALPHGREGACRHAECGRLGPVAAGGATASSRRARRQRAWRRSGGSTSTPLRDRARRRRDARRRGPVAPPRPDGVQKVTPYD